MSFLKWPSNCLFKFPNRVSLGSTMASSVVHSHLLHWDIIHPMHSPHSLLSMLQANCHAGTQLWQVALHLWALQAGVASLHVATATFPAVLTCISADEEKASFPFLRFLFQQICISALKWFKGVKVMSFVRSKTKQSYNLLPDLFFFFLVIQVYRYIPSLCFCSCP